MINQMADQIRFQKIAEDRMKSANLRELERYIDEEREEAIKEQLEFARKKRNDDIARGHNPLDVKNVTKTEWELLKEPNIFAKKSNMLDGENNVMKNNPNLLKSNGSLLKSNQNLLKGGNIFKI